MYAERGYSVEITNWQKRFTETLEGANAVLDAELGAGVARVEIAA